MRVVPPLDEFEDCHACLALGFETAPVEQLTFERGKETLAHGIGLRTFDLGAGVIDILDRQVQLVFVVFGPTAVFCAAISQHPLQRHALNDPAHVHRVGAFGGRQLERACRVLWNFGADDRAELRQVHPERLPRAAHCGAAQRAYRRPRLEEKPDPLGGCGKKARISYRILVEAGGIEPPSEDLQESATTRLFRNFELALRTPANGLP
jgi:hypothetical protein